MKTKTPRTDSAALFAVDTLLACKSEDDFHKAIKAVVKHLMDLARELEMELHR